MAENLIDATSAQSEGKPLLPRVLVVDVPGHYFDAITQSGPARWNKAGVQPLFMPYGIHSAQEIAGFVRDPVNKIDAVITGNKVKSDFYGETITTLLKQQEPAFAGPVIVAMTGTPYPNEDQRVKAAGAIGAFDKSEPEEMCSALLAALGKVGPAASL